MPLLSTHTTVNFLKILTLSFAFVYFRRINVIKFLEIIRNATYSAHTFELCRSSAIVPLKTHHNLLDFVNTTEATILFPKFCTMVLLPILHNSSLISNIHLNIQNGGWRIPLRLATTILKYAGYHCSYLVYRVNTVVNNVTSIF